MLLFLWPCQRAESVPDFALAKTANKHKRTCEVFSNAQLLGRGKCAGIASLHPLFHPRFALHLFTSNEAVAVVGVVGIEKATDKAADSPSFHSNHLPTDANFLPATHCSSFQTTSSSQYPRIFRGERNPSYFIVLGSYFQWKKYESHSKL